MTGQFRSLAMFCWIEYLTSTGPDVDGLCVRHWRQLSRDSTCLNKKKFNYDDDDDGDDGDDDNDYDDDGDDGVGHRWQLSRDSTCLNKFHSIVASSRAVLSNVQKLLT